MKVIAILNNDPTKLSQYTTLKGKTYRMVDIGNMLSVQVLDGKVVGILDLKIPDETAPLLLRIGTRQVTIVR